MTGSILIKYVYIIYRIRNDTIREGIKILLNLCYQLKFFKLFYFNVILTFFFSAFSASDIQTLAHA